MIGTEDLQWWHSQAAQLTWKSARTYARRAPHAYVVARQGEISEADFERASAVIRMFGQPGFYYQYPNIYLTSPDGQFKWWIMDDVGGNDLINRAAGDLWYGPQGRSEHLVIGVHVVGRCRADVGSYPGHQRRRQVRRSIIECFGEEQPKVLDLGCGTGALLDIRRRKDEKLLDPRNYTGVDPSQAMVNQLFLKHPSFARLVPRRFEDCDDLDDDYDLVVVIDVPGPDQERLRELASRLWVVRWAPEESDIHNRFGVPECMR